MIILRQRIFAEFDKKAYCEFLKNKGIELGEDGKYSEADWKGNKKAFLDSLGVKTEEVAETTVSDAAKFIEEQNKRAEIQAKKVLKEENEQIAKNSIFNKGKNFIKDTWAKHKTPIIAGGATIAAAGTGYGVYKHHKNKKEQEEISQKNDILRRKIVNGK